MFFKFLAFYYEKVVLQLTTQIINFVWCVFTMYFLHITIQLLFDNELNSGNAAVVREPRELLAGSNGWVVLLLFLMRHTSRRFDRIIFYLFQRNASALECKSGVPNMAKADCYGNVCKTVRRRRFSAEPRPSCSPGWRKMYGCFRDDRGIAAKARAVWESVRKMMKIHWKLKPASLILVHSLHQWICFAVKLVPLGSSKNVYWF